MNEHLNDQKVIEDIHDKLLFRFILKAVKQGLAFNCIVANKINELIQTKPYMKLEVEKSFEGLDEIPDWILTNSQTGRTLIGYNQIDLWGGGHQYNRASKYIIDNTIHERLSYKNAKLICVVCSFIEIKNTTNKLYNILQKGF